MAAELAATDPDSSAFADQLAALESQMAQAAVPAAQARQHPGSFTPGRIHHDAHRSYMLYQPAALRDDSPAPLLVLLHGCHQGAEAFAASTRMNEAAQDLGVAVLYPEKSTAVSVLRCWNWYTRLDRGSEKGDAAAILGMTRTVIAEHGIDPRRVYIAGMSAGGAMAAAIANNYPDLFAALGVHSGVLAGLADDIFSAMRLMSSGPDSHDADAVAATDAIRMATIVFHGDKDSTVHPANGVAIHSISGGERPAAVEWASEQVTTVATAARHGFTRSIERVPGGATQRELWMVHGAGHAWSGGGDGAWGTDVRGPDASREMLRFFLQHRLPSPTPVR